MHSRRAQCLGSVSFVLFSSRHVTDGVDKQMFFAELGIVTSVEMLPAFNYTTGNGATTPVQHSPS